MRRYLRLYFHFLRYSFSRAFEFRVDFSFRIVMDCVFYAVNLTFFTLLYNQRDQIGGWTIDQAYIFVAAFFFVDALHMTLFSNNMWWLPILVNKGDLDYYLVRPVSSLFFLSLREFAATSFINLIIATGACARANKPAFASEFSHLITSLTPSEYKSPNQLEQGNVLVVGGSASGMQIADELLQSGFEVTLSVGAHIRVPRQYRGRDVQWWMELCNHC